MSLTFDQSFDPRYGEGVEVAPQIVRVTAPNAGPMTFRGTNTYLLGERSLVLVDPGPDDAGHLAALLGLIANRPVSAILLTHGHRDHDGLAEKMRQATGAPILAAVGYGGAADGRLPDDSLVPGTEERIEVVATPGHTSDHLSFALPDQSIVLTGDHVMGWSTTVVAPPDGRMVEYMRSLERLAARRETRYLPGHGAPVEDGLPFLRALRVHRKLRETAILERLAAGVRDVPTLLDDLYRGLAPTLRPAAALSVLAHLIDLTERGRVEAPNGLTVDGRFYPSRHPTPPA